MGVCRRSFSHVRRPRTGCGAVIPPDIYDLLADKVVGLESFGRSGKAADLSRFFDITPEAATAAARRALERPTVGREKRAAGRPADASRGS